MKQVELYGRVRYAVIIQGMSRREAARMFGVDRRTVDKMLSFPEPPGYRRKKRPARPKLDPFDGIIDQILEKNIQNIGIWVNAHVRRYYPFGKRAMIGTGGTRHATPSTP